MEGLPLLPGYTFTNPGKTQFNVPHHLGWENGIPVVKKIKVGIGKEPLAIDSILYSRTVDPLRYDPSLTYGRTKPYVPPIFKPHFVLYDKKCLSFKGFFKQSVYGSPEENYRIRCVNVVYFLEDDKMIITEPPIENSGISQGTIVKKSKIPRGTSGAYWHWKDLNVGIDMPIYGIVIHLCSCDLYTKEFLTSQGIDVNMDEEMPEDPYIKKREAKEGPKIYPSMQRSDDKLRRFLEFDKKILRFYAKWDDRESEYGEFNSYIILFYLVDDTIEIIDAEKEMNGKDPHRLLLRKMKVPKNWKALPADYPGTYMERTDEDVVEYYQPKDFLIGSTVFILGRRFLLYDCDAFTRNYYTKSLRIDQGEPIDVELKKKVTKKEQPLPPYQGIGSVEDSIQSWYNVRPKPPRTDVVKYLHNMNKTLRYTAVMAYVHPEDENRKFIIEYRLSDATTLIHEMKIRNSGFTGGLFLKPTLIPKPNTDPGNPEYYSPTDFKIGANINVYGHIFKITGTDLAVYRYMEANPEKFPKEMLLDVGHQLLRDGLLNEDIKEVADYRRREEIAEPVEYHDSGEGQNEMEQLD